MTARLRIGTRGSPLARVQTALACRALEEAHPELAVPGALEVVVIRTTGDQAIDRPLAELGGKGLFCKEIEAALLAGDIDLAVHSMKDLPTWLPEGLIIGAVLPREDPRDVLIARAGEDLDDLPDAAVVGTASVRRRAQLLARRSDLRIVNFRGNVETRLRKLAAGEVNATVLALAGLKRLGIEPAGAVILAPEVMLPAVGQGAIGIECRENDDDARALLAALDGSCDTPIAGHAELDGGGLSLRALIARPDGSECLRAARSGTIADGAALGRDAGRELKTRAGPGFFD
jgi:hydroxymethylbilane synthase